MSVPCRSVSERLMGGDAPSLMEGKHLRLAFFDLAIFIAACEGEEFIIKIVSHIGTVAVAVVNEVEAVWF
jgi:hypothetical protein